MLSLHRLSPPTFSYVKWHDFLHMRYSYKTGNAWSEISREVEAQVHVSGEALGTMIYTVKMTC